MHASSCIFRLFTFCIRLSVVLFVTAMGISHSLVGKNVAKEDYESQAKEKLYYGDNNASQIHPVVTAVAAFIVSSLYCIAQLKQFGLYLKRHKSKSEDSKSSQSAVRNHKHICPTVGKYVEQLYTYIRSFGIWIHVYIQTVEVIVQLLSLVQYTEGTLSLYCKCIHNK